MTTVDQQKIAPLKPSDADALVRLDARANASAQEERRSAAFVAGIINLHAKLAFGVWHDDELIGAALGMATGKYGALVHCCVDPQYQRQGIGTTLAEAVVTNVLARAEVCIVQVSASAQWELAWLTSCGFQCVEPQLVLRRAVEGGPQHVNNQGVQVTQWQDLLNLAEYGTAMEGAGLGRLIRVGSPDACAGMLFVETVPRRQGASHSAAVSFGSVRRLLSCESLMAALHLAASVAREAQKRWLVATINGVYHRELEVLVKSGWTIAKTNYRLVHKKSIARYRQLQSLPQVDVSHWGL